MFRVLAQSAIGSTSAFAETLYTCPTGSGVEYATRNIVQVLVSSIVVCNRNASTARTYAIRVVPDGETPATKHVVFSDRSLDGSGTEVLSMGMGLQPGDRILVHAQSSEISMSVFGIEMV